MAMSILAKAPSEYYSPASPPTRSVHRAAGPGGRARFVSGGTRRSQQVIGLALWKRLKDGPAVVNVCALAKECGLSRTTVYRAIAFLMKYGKLQHVPGYSAGRGHPGRPQMYAIRPDLLEAEKALQERQNAERVHLSNNSSIQEREEEPLKAQPSDRVDSLTSWLAKADLSRKPTHREKRKLSAALRLLVPPSLADPLLAELWWRSHASLRLWADAISAVWRGFRSPIELPAEDITWVIRVELAKLREDGDRMGFRKALQDGFERKLLERQLARVRTRERGLKQWRQRQHDEGKGLSWFFRKRHELEMKHERLEETLACRGEGMLYCRDAIASMKRDLLATLGRIDD